MEKVYPAVFFWLMGAFLCGCCIGCLVTRNCHECHRKDAEIKHLKEQFAKKDTSHVNCVWIK